MFSSLFNARRALVFFPTAGLAAAYALQDDDRTSKSTFEFKTSPIVIRLGRVASTATTTLLDYHWSLRGLQGDALENAKLDCHQRGADRILRLAFDNGGIYVKLAQHIAMLDHLLPAPYVLTMKRATLDRCPVSPFSSVRQTIEEDLGRPLHDLFSHIEEKPIASASIAQVHIATDADTNDKVAVKVQHRGLRETSHVDLRAIEFMVKAIKLVSPSFDYMWLVNEAKENLPMELDFHVEIANAERCAEHFNSPRSSVRGLVIVPSIDHSKSSKRVLTMEFIDGVYVTDAQGLARLSCPPRELAKVISKAFNEMIFKFGDVHADPHAANMLVRETPTRPTSLSSTYYSAEHKKHPKWQLVLLDHGLYRKLDDSFRLEYASLWRSLIFGDVDGIQKSATAMNAGDVVPLFAGMLTQRPWRDVSKKHRGADRLKLKYTREEKEELQQFAGIYAKEIGALLARLPRELLLLLKTNDCLRAVDAELGAGFNNYIIMARECSRALLEQQRQQQQAEGDQSQHAHRSLKSRLALSVDSLKLECRLLLMSVMSWLAPWHEVLLGGKEEDDDSVGKEQQQQHNSDKIN